MQELLDTVVSLSTQKRKALAALLKKQGVNLYGVTPIFPRDPAEPVLLSYAQQRLWILSQLGEVGSAYNLSSVLRFKGHLDTQALQRSFEALIKRHETLRTTFRLEREQAVQVIHPHVPFELAVEVLVQADDSYLRQRVEAEAHLPFDLQQGPLLRVRLLRLAADEHVLVLTLHHIVSDGWSMPVMVNELVQLYHGYSQGQPVELPTLPVQYADYATWQRNWMEAGEQEKQLAYWTAQLGEEHPVLALPTDRPRPAVSSHQGARIKVALDQQLAGALKQLAQQQGVTPFMLLLASFQTLLHRYSGQPDIRVGVPVANRNRVETERLIGFFVNTQVLRAEFDLQMTFIDLLQQVKQRALGAQAHQDLPFEQLVEALQVERNLGHSPLFQVMYNHQTQAKGERRSLQGLQMEELVWDSHTAKFDLTLDTFEHEQGIGAALTYATDLFDAATIEGMARHWLNLLQGIVCEPGQRVADLPLLDEPERHIIMRGWNATEADYPAGQSIHQLIEAQVLATPDAPALAFGEQTLSYAELNRRSNQLAHKLREQGVGPDVLVGIAMERSLEMVIGLLGIVKAGGAYVPLDPEYPQDRLSYMFEDSGIALLLTQSHLHEALPIPAGLRSLDLDTENFDGYSDANPNIDVAPLNLAYVIYTSGSTGRPKGAGNSHQALVNRLCWMQKAYGLDASDSVLQKTPFSFDVSVWEFFWPLMTGARLVMAQPGAHRDPQLLVETINHHGISTLHFVPSMLQAFMTHEAVESCVSLKRVVCSGEALPAELARQTLQRLPAAGLYNLYGPTEAAIDVTHWTCQPDESISVPIGQPIDNLKTHILEGSLQPAVRGSAGELYLGGVGLARGYHQRPALTAERFVPDPFSDNGGRLYRTGDLARYRADGVIDYAGRIDHQVKIRGLRIELGEIEARLLELPSVQEAVVLAQDGPSGKQLVGYVVPADSTQDEGALRDSLREALKAGLPDYMVPAHLLLLGKLPVTPNGKLDRKALPQADASQSQGEYIAPQSALEQQIAAIWADVLKLERVGLDDHFFMQGGHSLLAVSVIARIRQHLGLDVQLLTLFEAPVLRDFAKRVEHGERAQAAVIECVSRAQPLALSYAQQRQWFLWQWAPHSATYNIPAALKLAGALDVAALQQAFGALIERHETLRTTFRLDGEHAVQVIHDQVPFELAIEEQAHADEAAVRAWVEAEAGKPFDLEQGPLLRARLLGLAADQHVLVLTLHHIVADGWSMPVLVEELVQLYAGYSQGQVPTLPVLPIQYADFAVWQRNWMEAGEQARQLAYWTEQLGDEQPVLELPLDHPRPAVPSHQGARWPIELGDELAANLKRVAQQQGVTPFMLLLASFQTLLHRYSGQADIRVGVPTANRNRVETERLIGFFVNTQVLRAEFDVQLTFSELLQQVRQRTLGAQAHQDLPFEQLVEALQPERNLGHNPLFQVLYNHQTELKGSQHRLPGLEMSGLEWSTNTAKFDLSLDTFEHEKGIGASLTYATDLFDASTIERMARHWLNLLEAIVRQPGQRISELPLLGEDEQQAVLRDWTRNTAAFPDERSIHELIEAQVATAPDAPAVTFGEQTLSYDELNRRANQLAHKLIERGVGPDVLVGIAMERSLDMVVGLLGILKAGGAYVPLDPEYPEDRLSYMFADSGITLLLTQSHLREALPIPLGLHSLDLDVEDLTGYSDANPNIDVAPQNLAYVIYTSGSTGKPKGTLLPHQNVVRLFAATQDWFRFDASDVWTVFHSYAFDFSVWELFGALLYGGRAVMVAKDVARSTEDFHALLQREQVTVLNQTPSAFRQLIPVACAAARQGQGQGLALRHVVFGGEALDVGSLEPWFEVFGDRQPRLINMYGITETTVHVTYRPITQADLAKGASSPIGEVIPDLSWYLLDAALNPVAPGSHGELVIGQAGLARGYHGRPGLTAERFVPNPFDSQGGRLYRSGDLARYGGAGVVEYLGRIDHQVKIRGFRIELGEIEARLQAQASVAQGVVLAQDGPGGKQLVGYVVPADAAVMASTEAQAAERDALRTALKASLPDYMVPAHLLFLARLPLTANGKLDRRALPQPDASLLQAAYVAPQSELEQQIAAIWADVLKLERVGLGDNFFELGGHSLLAVQVISRVRQSLGVELQLRALFETSSLADFARLAAQGEQACSAVIARVSRKQPLALSYAQQRQWFLWQWAPHTATYNIPAALKLAGALDVAALQQAFGALIERHETLRTTFRLDGEQAVQVIHDQVPFELAIEEQAHADEAAVRAWVEAEAGKPFDLEQGPLLRARLLGLAADQHVLVLTLHHIVADGWSMPVLVEELVQLYAGYSQGQAPTLPVLPIQYADFAVWQRNWMEAGEQARQLAYWTEQLGDEQPVLELPLDHPRPAVPSHQGARWPIELGNELAANLKRVAQQQNVTPFMLLLASFQTLLHRYSGQADIRVGVPTANRNRVETERLIGFFVNTQVLRAEFDMQLTFGELLQQVKQRVLGAQAHQDLPFEQLVEALQPERNLGHNPLFQVLYNHQTELKGSQHRLPGLEMSGLDWSTHTAKFDLSLDTYEDGQGIGAALIYATDLFDASTIERMARHWVNLLEAIVHQPGQRISELPLLGEDEQQAVLRDWNRNTVAFPDERTIHELIEAKVVAAPEAPAVTFGEQTLSYGELNRRANRLAHKLIERGVGPDVLVGIAMERSLEMVVGLLGILKAGGAYVPLDPEYPEDRLSYMFADSGITLLLTQAHLREVLPIPVAIECLELDELALASYSGANPGVTVAPQNLAYVIYTSGSTGKPKGTLLPHQNVVRLFAATQAWFRFDASDVWTVFHSYAFDFSVWELFGALLYGGRAVMVAKDVARSTEDFHALLQREQVTVLNQTPSAFRQLIPVACASARQGQGLALRHVVFGGEALDVSSLAPWFEAFGDQQPRLINMYGITETTVHVTYRPITQADLAKGASSPIGEVIPDLSWYLLDAALNPVAPGSHGELVIGQAGLARGYHGRPGLTAERFVPNPFDSQGGRLYRSGDLARYGGAGVVEYLGRIDHQVKIRGFRIELGEIEARLQAQASVAQGVVLAQDGPGGKQLVGYVVPADEAVMASTEAQAAEREALRTALKANLPDYMVPAHLLFLAKLPLTANGKLDRRALPQPDASQLQRAYHAPQSELEQRIAAIWADVLKLERVGLGDNFFELGGHSLLATQVMARLQVELGTSLPLALLFQAQTLQDYAAMINSLNTHSDADLDELQDFMSELEAV